MKIAFITTDNRENFREYARERPYFGTAPAALLQGFSKLDVEVHVISCTQKTVKAPEKLSDNIWFHSLHVPKLGWLRTGYSGCIFAVKKKIKEIQPDIVHGQGTERNCAICAVFSGFPNIVTVHGNMRLIAELKKAKPFSFFWCSALLEKFTLPKTMGIICITRYTELAVSKLQSNTWLLPNAVDESFFHVKRQKSSQTVFVCVADVDSRKNQMGLIQVLDQLMGKNFKVLFYGRIEENASYTEDFLSAVKARPWCSYEGFADASKIREVFSKSTALILPSFEDNCPMVVLEAMAAGLPVIASNVGGIPELIQDRHDGLLFDPHNSDSMRNVLEEVLCNPSLLEKLAENARVLADEYYRPVRIAQKHLEIYRKVLSSKS